MTQYASGTLPGIILGEAITALGLTVAEAAVKIATARPLLHALISNRKPISVRMASRIETTLGIPARPILIAQIDQELAIWLPQRERTKAKPGQ
jgi:plasmid maintenance system antidote protein VapI